MGCYRTSALYGHALDVFLKRWCLREWSSMSQFAKSCQQKDARHRANGQAADARKLERLLKLGHESYRKICLEWRLCTQRFQTQHCFMAWCRLACCVRLDPLLNASILVHSSMLPACRQFYTWRSIMHVAKQERALLWRAFSHGRELLSHAWPRYAIEFHQCRYCVSVRGSAALLWARTAGAGSWLTLTTCKCMASAQSCFYGFVAGCLLFMTA